VAKNATGSDLAVLIIVSFAELIAQIIQKSFLPVCRQARGNASLKSKSVEHA
jgi:hypothetical protein